MSKPFDPQEVANAARRAAEQIIIRAALEESRASLRPMVQVLSEIEERAEAPTPLAEWESADARMIEHLLDAPDVGPVRPARGAPTKRKAPSDGAPASPAAAPKTATPRRAAPPKSAAAQTAPRSPSSSPGRPPSESVVALNQWVSTLPEGSGFTTKDALAAVDGLARTSAIRTLRDNPHVVSKGEGRGATWFVQRRQKEAAE